METDGTAPIAILNGREVEVRPGDTILAAAKRLGIDIPTLCHHESLPVQGGCRMCVVYSAAHERPLAACHTPLEPGMDLLTHHVSVERLRKTLMSLRGATADATGFSAAGVRYGRYAALASLYGGGDGGKNGDGVSGYRDRTHPMMRFRGSACIDCRLCLEACEELAGQSVFQLGGRGVGATVGIVGERTFSESPCVACGACAEVCPTGAVRGSDGAYGSLEEYAVETVPTVCGFCGVGCRMEGVADLEEGENVVRVAGIRGAAVNDGLLCQRGRFGYRFQRSWDRLEKPMLRQGAGFREVSWEEALDFLEGKLRTVLDESGPGAFGAIASTRATNESVYLLQKFCRSVIGSPHVDSAARLCHVSGGEALRRATGASVGTGSFADIEAARCIVVAGANPDVSHPVLGNRIRRAVARGARLVVLDVRWTEMAERADVFLQVSPGTDVAVFHALALALMEGGHLDRGGLLDRTEGLKAYEDFVAEFPVEAVEDFAGLRTGSIRAAAALIGKARERTLFLYGLGLTQQFHGTGAVESLWNLAVLAGCVGGRGGGIMPFGGQNNLQGCLDLGGATEWLPGHYPARDPEAVSLFTEAWGRLPDPESVGPGLNSLQMIEAAAAGRLRALWVQGHDLLRSLPREDFVAEALGKLDLLVVQELFYTEMCAKAHLLLPSASFLEQDGTFTSAERRIQRLAPVVPPPGEARPDWTPLVLMARRLGVDWKMLEASQIFAEIARLVPDLFGGVSHARLREEPDGLQWPCPNADHPGTPTLHTAGMVTGKARFFPVDVPLSIEHRVPDYPFLAMTGRALEHHNTGSMTRRGPARNLRTADTVELHPQDAARAGIADGARVRVESRHGACVAIATLTPRIRPGALWLTNHFPQTHANRLFGDVADPESGCPQFKAVAVRVEPAAKG